MDSNKIAQYLEAKNSLAHYKKLEAELRIDLLDDLFPSAGEGTLNTVVGDFIVKGTFKNSISIDKDILERTIGDFEEEELECISFKPALSLSKYKQLDDRSNIDECLTSKPSMPTISIKVVSDE